MNYSDELIALSMNVLAERKLPPHKTNCFAIPRESSHERLYDT